MGPLLGVSARPVSEAEAAAIAHATFGVEGRARPLGGERDQNFRIDAPDGRSYVLKLAHPAEPRSVAAFQTAALLHIAARDPGLAVPHVVQTRSGAPIGEVTVNGEQRGVRLLSWLSGEMLYQASPDIGLLERLGDMAARLDHALAGLETDGAEQDLLWDFDQVPRLRPLLAPLAGDPVALLARRAIETFEAEVVPAIPALRRQYIHNDLNPHNVLVGDRMSADAPAITGVLDFGDMVHGYLVGELAIACSYHLDGDPALGRAAACIGGYHARLPLLARERALLPAFIAARLAMTVLITEWRARENPQNRAYILRNNPAARIGLQSLSQLGVSRVEDVFAAACAEAPAG